MDLVEEPVESLAPYKLPPPPVLTRQELTEINQGTIKRVFGMMDSQADSGVSNPSKSGLNRLAASKLDKNAWWTVVTRLATRASSALDEEDDEEFEDGEEEEEDAQGSKSLTTTHTRPGQGQQGQGERQWQSLRKTIHETMYLYILEDFRKRIDAAVSWLNEEWYNDRIQQKQKQQIAASNTTTTPTPSKDDDAGGEGGKSGHYEKLALRILDGLIPYLDTRDKIFTRFVSELPEINGAILDRVKSLARDPERVGLAVNTLQLVLRPFLSSHSFLLVPFVLELPMLYRRLDAVIDYICLESWIADLPNYVNATIDYP